MDLSQFQFSDTATLHVRSPIDGKPLFREDGSPITITLSGRDSKLYADAQRAMVEARLNSDAPVDADEATASFMARCTVSWSGIEYNGDVLEKNFETARSLYKRLPWLREQIDNFASNRGNFIATSSEG